MLIRFGEFSFDADRREIRRAGVPVHLSPKEFRLLELLMANRPRAMTKEALYHDLWPDTFVEEVNLANLISRLRAALGDDSRSPRFVRTIYDYGYAFQSEEEHEQTPVAPASNFQLVCGRRRFDLNEGENVIGRDAAIAIDLDVPGISRRHARISVCGETITIEDLGSKNGTRVRGTTLTTAMTLDPGEEFWLGRTVLRVDRVPRASTKTEAPP